MNKLFFELIQVSLGTRTCISPTPSATEWSELYGMAKKQSVVGVCFAGVQRALSNCLLKNEEPSAIGMPEMLYLTWMGMAAKIQQRNEVVNQQCIELQKMFEADGMHSCVLKGQGIAALYKSMGQQDNESTSDLSLLRQSGDIDLWVDASKEKIITWAKAHGETEPAGYLHVGCHVFDDTEVELHYRPTYCKCLWHNKRMQDFCKSFNDFKDFKECKGFVVPSYEFNVVYILSHIYRHLFGFGIGMRQLMDYYFVLKSKDQQGNESINHRDIFSNSLIRNNLKSLGLDKFAGAVMWVMREVFLLDEQYIICPVDEKSGRALLRDVMLMGNFGHLDEKQKQARKTKAGSLWWKLKRDMELVRFYPAETLCEPIWKLVRMIKK